jgi:hypothetical protein
MDISYMPNTQYGYHLLVVVTEYISRWAECPPLMQSISEKVTDFMYEEVNCLFRNPESLVVD